jgi:hypothetical protein
LTSIALKNPEIYQTFASILSTIICNLNENKKQKIIELIVNKFKNKPNSEYLFLWLQRIAIVANIRIDHKESEEKLFKLVVRKHSDGDTIVRHFNPVPVTDEHFIIFKFIHD